MYGQKFVFIRDGKKTLDEMNRIESEARESLGNLVTAAENAVVAAEDAAEEAASNALTAIGPALEEAIGAAEAAAGAAETAVDASIETATYDAEADALVLTRSSGAEVTAPFNGVFMPSVLHDYSHGIPLGRLAPEGQQFDFTGTLNMREMLSAAIIAAQGRTILIPRNSTLFLDLTTPFTVPAAGMKLKGHDWTSVIRYYENSIGTHSGEPDDNGYFDIFSINESGPIWIENLKFEGPGLVNPTPYEGSIRILNGVNSGKVTLRRVWSDYSRAVAFWCQGPNGFDMEGCRISHTQRGGMQVRFARDHVRLVNNEFDSTRDDSININWNWNSRFGPITDDMSRSVEVLANTFFASGGIRVIGASQGRIADNIGRFTGTHMIAVGLPEDDAIPLGDMVIENNLGIDSLSEPLPYGHGSDYAFIRVRGTIPMAGALPAIPGKHDPGTGDYIDPEKYMTTPSAAGAPTPAGRRVIIRGNKYGRKHQPGDFLTHWFGFEAVINGHNGGMDTITPGEENLRPVGILLEGAIDGLEVYNNTIETVSHFLTWDFLGAPDDTSSAIIRNNRFADCSVSAFEYLSTGSAPPLRQDMTISYNVFDGDPRQKSAARAPGKIGAWISDTSNASVGQAFKAKRQLSGATLIGNSFANFARIADSSFSYFAVDNVLHGQPVVGSGYHADNRGIGAFPAVGDGWSWVIRESNPRAGSAYGVDLFRPPRTAQAMPASGLFVAGHYVRNTGSDRSVTGWYRATTGSDHVLGVDWIADRAPSGPGWLELTMDANSNPDAFTAAQMTIMDTATLTADRLLNLPAGTPAGTIARVRRAPGLAFNRNVRDGNTTISLLLMAAGQEAEFRSTGTAWSRWDVQAPAPIVSVTGTGNSVSATITAGISVVSDTAALLQSRNLMLNAAPAGTIIHYANETTGGFTRTLINPDSSVILATTAGQGARLYSTGTAWKLLP